MRKIRRFISWWLVWASLVFICLYILSQITTRLVWEDLICETRYVWSTYKWTVLAKDWDYIYLSWTSEVVFDCTIAEDKVTEDTPLCWTYVPFNWPLDTSNMNCYKWDDDIHWKLTAFRKQEEESKKEDEKYFVCDLKAEDIVDIYNSCETYLCAENRLRTYLEQQCPRATIK